MSHQLADALGATLAANDGNHSEIVVDRLKELAIEMRSGRWGEGPELVARAVKAHGSFVSRPLAVDPGGRHPEQRDGEVFLTNTTLDDFRKIGHASARAGLVAYDTTGRPIASLSPVFVDRGELAENLRAGAVRFAFDPSVSGKLLESVANLESGADSVAG